MQFLFVCVQCATVSRFCDFFLHDKSYEKGRKKVYIVQENKESPEHGVLNAEWPTVVDMSCALLGEEWLAENMRTYVMCHTPM